MHISDYWLCQSKIKWWIFYLQDAMHLNHRPFLHCTSLVLAICVLMWCYSYYMKSRCLEQLAWMTVAAGISHHIRDGTRRGLWFCPFGSTPPIPYNLYVGTLTVFPYICLVLMRYTETFWAQKAFQNFHALWKVWSNELSCDILLHKALKENSYLALQMRKLDLMYKISFI